MVQKSEVEQEDLIEIWKRFIVTFKDPASQDYIYQSQIDAMAGRDAIRYVIDYSDLSNIIPKMSDDIPEKKDYEILTHSIVGIPDVARESGTIAAYQLLTRSNKEYADYVRKDFRMAFKNTPIRREIGELEHTDEDKIASIAGIVTEVQDPLILTKQMTWKCANGHEMTTYVEGLHLSKPSRCDTSECNSTKFEEFAGLTDTYQQIKLQRKISDNSSTKIPRELTVIILGKDLSDVSNPGDYVICDGVIKKFDLQKTQVNALGTFYLDAHWIHVQKEEFVDTDADLDNKVHNAIRKGHEKEDFLKLAASISPAIHGGIPIKTNLLLMLAGSDPRWLLGKKRHRGELQLLAVGDAATSKTSLAEHIIQCFNRGVWASGVKGASTAVGLRASIVRDETTNTSKLTAGAYVIASTKYGGLVVIDEVADMSTEDYRSILEATDDRQMLTIRKSQISKEIQVNCASLHLCNPKTPGRRWDDTKNIHENTGLDTPMLTRYDTIWVLRDIMDEKLDKEVGKHLVNMISSGMTDEEYQKHRGRFDSAPVTYSPHFLQAWAQYVRKTFHPRLIDGTKPAASLLEFYLTMRQSAKLHNERQTEASKVISKITPRELGNLVRLTEASARAHHRDAVIDEDAEIAISLVRDSMASSGFDPMTGVWKPISVMNVSAEHVVQSENQSKSDKIWKQRARIMFDIIEELSIKPCTSCRSRGYVIEKSKTSDISEERMCDVCEGKARVADIFKEQDLVRRMMEETGNEDETDVKQFIDLIKDGSNTFFLENSGMLKVGDWDRLEKWCNTHSG